MALFAMNETCPISPNMILLLPFSNDSLIDLDWIIDIVMVQVTLSWP